MKREAGSCKSYAEPQKPPPEILELTQKGRAAVGSEGRQGLGMAVGWGRVGGPVVPRKDEKHRPNGPCHSVFPICPLIVHKQRAVLS